MAIANPIIPLRSMQQALSLLQQVKEQLRSTGLLPQYVNNILAIEGLLEGEIAYSVDVIRGAEPDEPA